jgi:hypothetical protein
MGYGMYEGTCMSQDPDRRRITVMLRSGMIVDCQLMSHGPNDALRVHHGPMPTVTTSCVVQFVHGDVRNCVLIGTLNRNQQDAFTTAPGDEHAHYESDWSGGWRYRSSNGQFADVYPDGTAFIVGFGGSIPTTYRHVVTSGQARERQALTPAQRRPAAASAYPITLAQSTGAALEFSAAGSVSLASATGHQNALQSNGADVTLSGTGAVVVLAASGQTVTLQANGGTVVIDSSGNMTLTPAGGQVTINGTLNVTSLNVNGASYAGHEHIDTQPGTGRSGPPG